MSHTSDYGDVTFIHDSDLKGNVKIVVRDSTRVHGPSIVDNPRDDYWSVEVPGETLKQLVMDCLRIAMITSLENMSYPDLEDFFTWRETK